MYELYLVRSHWTYPSSKSSGHIVLYGGDLVVVMATVLTFMYTEICLGIIKIISIIR